MIIEVTAAEKQAIDLLREIKTRTGHGRLVVDVVAGAETMLEFTPTFKIKPLK